MRNSLKLISRSAAETKKIGKILGKYLKTGDVVALQGPLGSGKTTLAKGMAKGLGVLSDRQVSSPSFVLIHEYQGREKIYHLDWYRLKSVKDADADLARECLGAQAVTFVEWPQRGRKLLPSDAVHIYLSHRGPGSRRLYFSFPAKTNSGVLQALKKI